MPKPNQQPDEQPNVHGVLYVYRCPECRHRGEVRLPDDTHDGEAATCSACGGPVTLEWDGGVTLEAKGRP